MSVKSPYNFVPAPKESEVFLPDWADQVSHDIPFSDGESGEINFMLTSMTPVFIRDGHAEGSDTSEFSHIIVNGKKRYFIPATSIKGMIRNVLEIMTRSRMKHVDDHRHAVRQIMKQSDIVIDEGYSLRKIENRKEIQAGYLVKKNNAYFIYSCGRPLKIRYTDIDDYLKTDFGKQFDKTAGLSSEMDKKFSNRTGKYKYEKVVKGKELEHIFKLHPLDDVDEKGKEYQKSWVSKFQPLQYVQFADADMDEDAFPGRIVCTGQAADYSVPTARRGEYVFRGKRAEVIADDRNRIEVPEDVMETFLFVNRDNLHDQLDDWGYWKDKEEEGVPVFFRTKNAEGRTVVKDFGLTLMYKEPVKYSVKEVLNYREGDKDFTEVLFGYASKIKSLKGRVMMSHAFCVSEIEEDKLETLQGVFSSPKSSYVPFYIKQKGENGKTRKYNTYNSNPGLRGYKRYPVHKNVKKLNTGSEKMTTHLQPLPKGVSFSTKIRFHNLRKVEIGALLSALTFHGASEQLYHSLGAAKPFGYGKMKVQDVSIKTFLDGKWKQQDVSKYLQDFECEMRTRIVDWAQSQFIKEFLAMAHESKNDDFLQYMPLEDFQKVKNEGYFLQDYSVLSGNAIHLNSKCMDKEAYEQTKSKRVAQFKEEQNNKLEVVYSHELKKIDVYIQENEFEKARQIITDYQDIDLFKKKIKELEKAECRYHSEEAWRQVDENSIKEVEKYIERYPDAFNIEEAKKILEDLKQRKKEGKKDKAYSEIFEVDYSKGFDSFKKRINKDHKAAKSFSPGKKQWLKKVISNFYAKEAAHEIKKKKFFRGKTTVPFHKNPWTDISKWLGEEDAKRLFDELTCNG